MAMRTPVEGRAVLVTGGAGFIGSHLVRALARRGAARIVVLDRLGAGDTSRLGDALDPAEVARIELGLAPQAEVTRAVRGVDFVFHLAAEKHSQSRDDPIGMIRANVDGTRSLLEAAAAARVRRVVFASSLYVYGRMSGPPMREDEVPQPATMYGVSKLAGEQLLAHYGRERGLAGNVLRFFFVYGPRQFAGRGYPSVIVKNFERLLAGEPPVVYGDGEQALDYVYVDDVVDALVRAAEAEIEGDVLNVASGTATPIRRLVDVMQDVAGTALPVRFEPGDWTAGSVRAGDAARAGRRLGWRATTDLRDGLERTFRWLAERRATA